MSDTRRLAAGMICAGFTPENRGVIDELIDAGLGAVILFSGNITGGPEQVAELVGSLKARAGGRPLLVGIDHEGGRVSRMRQGFSPVPSMREVGAGITRTGDFGIAREVGQIMGRELRAAGIDINFAPVVDVDTNPANPVIADRSFGSDPALVARAGAELVRGMQAEGVAACCKHFPGHGDTSVDSHYGLPVVEHDFDRLERVEIAPFRAGVEAGVACVMTAHVVVKALDPERPATISPRVLGLLRAGGAVGGGASVPGLGFGGVIVSDDFEMKALADHFPFEEAVVAGVEAGLDMVCVCHTPDLQWRAIESITERVPEERLRESGARLERLCARFWRPVSGDGAIDTGAHRAILARIGTGATGTDPTEAWRG